MYQQITANSIDDIVRLMKSYGRYSIRFYYNGSRYMVHKGTEISDLISIHRVKGPLGCESTDVILNACEQDVIDIHLPQMFDEGKLGIEIRDSNEECYISVYVKVNVEPGIGVVFTEHNKETLIYQVCDDYYAIKLTDHGWGYLHHPTIMCKDTFFSHLNEHYTEDYYTTRSIDATYKDSLFRTT